jgi:hypothetical protein
VAAAFVAIAAGCGGTAHRATPPPPKLPHDLAAQLVTLSDQVAAQLDGGDACAALTTAQQLNTSTIEAIDSGRVPVPLQRPLHTATDDLVSGIDCTPRPPDEHGKHKGKGHGDQNSQGGGGD